MSARRERERTEMRERIIEAARRLFVTDGYDRTTLRRIAEEIEYTPGAIYAYFKDKDAILYALHQQGFEELGRRMMEAIPGAQNPREVLDRLGRAYLAFARDNPEMYDLMFIAQATSRAMQEQWPEGERTYEMLKMAVKTAIDGGWIIAGDVEAVSFMLWSTAHGMASLSCRDRCLMIPEAERPKVLADAYEVLLRLLSTGKESSVVEATARSRRGAPEA